MQIVVIPDYYVVFETLHDIPLPYYQVGLQVRPDRFAFGLFRDYDRVSNKIWKINVDTVFEWIDRLDCGNMSILLKSSLRNTRRRINMSRGHDFKRTLGSLITFMSLRGFRNIYGRQGQTINRSLGTLHLRTRRSLGNLSILRIFMGSRGFRSTDGTINRRFMFSNSQIKNRRNSNTFRNNRWSWLTKRCFRRNKRLKRMSLRSVCINRRSKWRGNHIN